MKKKRIPSTPEELEGSAKVFFASIKAESDRGCALVAAAFLEEALEALLRTQMSPDQQAAEGINQLFRPDGALGSFSAKIGLCRALQLIGPEDYADLTKIRKLRNLLAHSHGPAEFSDPQVKDTIDGLSILNLFEASTSEPPEPRRIFELAASWLAGGLHNRIKV